MLLDDTISTDPEVELICTEILYTGSPLSDRKQQYKILYGCMV
jgi:hypothetical protein